MDRMLIQLQKTLQGAGVETATLGLLFETREERVYGLSVYGSQAIATWLKLREIVPQTSSWPVLVEQGQDVEDLKARVHFPDNEPTSRILEVAAQIDPYAWFRERHEKFTEEIHEFGYKPDPATPEVEQELYGMPRGTWPEEVPAPHEFVIPKDLVTGRPHDKVHIALIPTEVGWQAPAFLKFGAWNECPAPKEHVALMRFWSERFGAEVVGIARDVVEMMVRRPPSTRGDALRLASQQYLYCEDIVNQGTESVERLAATLLGAKAWFFWWD